MRVLVALMFVAALCAASPAFAERRVALVIGNNSYERLSADQQLRSAINDARLMKTTLESLDFSVIVKEDVRRADLVDALSEFASRIGQGDIAFFFYAGHGVALNGANYILPSDITSPRAAGRDEEARLMDNALAESRVIERMKGAGARVALVVLDACRDNPLAPSGGRSVGGARGLAPPPEAEGLMSIYSAGVGQMAWERLDESGRDKNSVFTRIFAEVLKTPGLDLQGVARETRRRVADLAKSAGRTQTPGYYEQIDGAIYLAGRGSGQAVSAPSANAAADSQQAEFATAMQAGTAAALDGFLTKYPSGPLANIARRELEKLKGQTTAASPSIPSSSPGSHTLLAMVAPVPSPATTGGTCGGVTLASLGSRSPRPLSRQEECAVEAGAEFKECETCPTMVVIPAGSFTMGSPKNEKGRSYAEFPEHRVTISSLFAAGKFTVTFEEWDACVSDSGCGHYKPKDEGWGRGRMPVINVSWEDAKAYAAWLSKKTGKTYRLLSEAEWEYAARGGTTTPFWWGSSISTEQAKYNENYSDSGGKKGIFRGRTVPVDSFRPNPFGLYQVHGNVGQWVDDCKHEGFSGAPSDGSAWKNKSESCGVRVFHGGSWKDSSERLRAAARDWRFLDLRDNDVGFRLARTFAP